MSASLSLLICSNGSIHTGGQGLALGCDSGLSHLSSSSLWSWWAGVGDVSSQWLVSGSANSHSSLGMSLGQPAFELALAPIL